MDCQARSGSCDDLARDRCGYSDPATCALLRDLCSASRPTVCSLGTDLGAGTFLMAGPRGVGWGFGAGHRFALALMAGVVLLWLAVLTFALRAAALPGEASGTMFVVFVPGISEDQAFASTVAAGGRPVRRALGSFAWIVHGEDEGFVGHLKENGALAA